jgi:D-alanine-D-alanine ligase
VQDALERLGHDTLVIDVGPDLVEQLQAASPDVALITLHGRDGEDGTVQGLLEAIGVPYAGSGPSACLRCADKVLAKHLMRDAGIPTPDFFSFNENALKDLGAGAALPDMERRLDFPIVVKPAGQGSALGVQFARSTSEIPSALVAAFSYDDKVLLEHYVRGRDLAVSVLQSPQDGQLQALPVVEAIAREEDFYDFEARYEIGRTTFVCPAELDEQITRRAHELALQVYRLLGCHGFARVDLMLAENGQDMFVLETDTIPGLTETSLLPQAADAAGIDFDDLVSQILASAWTRP